MVTLAACCMAVACTLEEIVNGDIAITSGSRDITVYADQTGVNNGQGLSFITTGAWYAMVTETTRSADAGGEGIDWIILSRTSGDSAGDYTIDIMLTVNETGADRSAVIRIFCGDSMLTVTVTQRGITSSEGDGDDEGGKPTPVPVSTRRVASISCSKINYYEPDVPHMLESHLFRYDSEGRVAEWEIERYSEYDVTM